MQDESHQRRRKLLRLTGYDYSSEGGYFITNVTRNQNPIFGSFFNSELVLSKAGQVAQSEWFRTMQLRNSVELFEDEFVVMPNHIHGIIWFKDGPSVGVERRRDLCVPEQSEWYRPLPNTIVP